ncbi:hypothetical protein ACHRV5_20885 [Flavobacterium sp. FlaQc-52]|jgi:hypothetical protein|uniref:hypothetical protein n=1 Tax=Flavobacterium TaxID=237 RepID=UPI000AEFEB0B|nr:hypothetical protein [Flavobacterium sp. F-323]UFH43818.1 hypothetical protein LNP23_06275 [Flavobacterium sp. F-323]
MLKNILQLEGAQELTKNEKKGIKGGLACDQNGKCPKGSYCDYDSSLCKRI